MSQTYHIERLDQNGHGLSISKSGQITSIEGVISGETVTAKIKTSPHKSAMTVLSSIIKASPQRRTPPCPHYKLCGGCDLQHMTYTCQLQEKQAILAGLFRQSNHPQLKEQARNLTLPVASPDEFHYRQRIRLQVDDRQVLGFHKRRSHACVEIDTCMVAQPEINHCLSALRPLAPFQKLLRHTDALEILFDPETTNCHLLFHFTRKPRPNDMQQGKELSNAIPKIRDVFFSGEGFAVSGHESITFELPPFPPHTNNALKLSLETGGFCQVNVAQNSTLVQTVLDFCTVGPQEDILDLFCGMGNFSIPLAEKAGSVLGIEGQGSAIRSAKKNSKTANQTNSNFKKQAIHDACGELARAGKSYHCIILDPPRQGIPGLARILAALCRSRMVYVSCDPVSLCRDLEDLLQHGFRITKLQAMDMFPQTHHIETVVLLEKSAHPAAQSIAL
jgi:23S rRNA (uracil1939-C5)-methyltransferase